MGRIAAIPKRHIVNGQLLSKYINQPVSITGIVNYVHQSGESFRIRTFDDMTVQIDLPFTLDSMVDVYVEVHGISKGTSVLATNLFEFTYEESADFDNYAHNQLCNMLHTLNDVFTYFDS